MSETKEVHGRPDDRIAVGQRGEDLAAAYLREQGMLILDRNWRPHGAKIRGERDVVARDGDTLVIVEVKTRRSIAFGAPLEAVTQRKLRALRSLALAWLDQRCVHAPAMRFDVVGVTLTSVGQPIIEHLRAV